MTSVAVIRLMLSTNSWTFVEIRGRISSAEQELTNGCSFDAPGSAAEAGMSEDAAGSAAVSESSFLAGSGGVSTLVSGATGLSAVADPVGGADRFSSGLAPIVDRPSAVVGFFYFATASNLSLNGQ